MQPHDLPLARRVGRHGDHGRHARDPDAGRVQPQAGPVALERAAEEGVHAVADVLAQLAGRALADAVQAHGLDQAVHAPGRGAAGRGEIRRMCAGLLDHGGKGLLRRCARLRKGREAAALPQLGDAQMQAARARVERPAAAAVAAGGPLRRALLPPGAGQAVHVGLHQQLHHGLRHRAQEVAASGFGHQLGQGRAALGRRVLLGWG